jgi:arylsulfatase A-like enzyme
VPLRLRTVRTERYKLTLELDSGAGELYDLRDDADEMHNRFDDPAMAGVRRELTAAIGRRPSQGLAPRYEPSGMA